MMGASHAKMTLQWGNVNEQHFENERCVIRMQILAHGCHSQSDRRVKPGTMFLQSGVTGSASCRTSPVLLSIRWMLHFGSLWAGIKVFEQTNGFLRREKWTKVVREWTTNSNFVTFNFKTPYVSSTFQPWNNFVLLVQICNGAKQNSYQLCRQIRFVERHIM